MNYIALSFIIVYLLMLLQCLFSKCKKEKEYFIIFLSYVCVDTFLKMFCGLILKEIIRKNIKDIKKNVKNAMYREIYYIGY